MSQINYNTEMIDDTSPWCFLYHDDAFFSKEGRLMGRHAAGLAYLRAIAESEYSQTGVIIKENDKENFLKLFKSLLGNDQKKSIDAFPFNAPHLSKKYGGIFLGDPRVGHYSFLRSKFSHDAYSIVGITHTTMSKGIMDFIQDLTFKPVKDWDALICTSNCVKDTILKLIEINEEFLKNKFSIKGDLIRPELPIIPLGVHTQDYNFNNQSKIDARELLNIGSDDIVLVFVGRLSFHAKAHHFPMYKALQEISKKNKGGQKIHLIQAGWFANDYIGKTMQEEAKLLCPDVSCHFLDGRNQSNKFSALACADIFISLSDNFQETFGLTPLEGMASGLPVVVTDWNGYRDTVRNNIDGFCISTTSLQPGNAEDLAFSYFSEHLNYDQYLSYSSQRVAVNIGECIEKIHTLINNKDLRLKMGNEGKRRAKLTFEWSEVLKSYSDLRLELDKKRSKNKDSLSNNINFINEYDLFNLFENYPTNHLKKSTKLKANIKSILDEDHYIFNSPSIHVGSLNGLNLVPDIKQINSIISLLVKKELFIKDIQLKVDYDNQTLMKILIFMLKFDLIIIVSE